MNSVCEEQCEGDPHADSTAVSAVTQDDHWIMMLESEAPQADLSKETSFKMCAVTLRTACGQALESYGRCDIQNAGSANRNSSKSDVSSGGCALPDPVGGGTSRQGSPSDVSRARGGAEDGGWSCRTTDTHSRSVVSVGLDRHQQRVRSC